MFTVVTYYTVHCTVDIYCKQQICCTDSTQRGELIFDGKLSWVKIVLCHYTNMFCKVNLIQNSQAVKKVCGPQKGYGEKRCEIQGGGQEMAVVVG